MAAQVDVTVIVEPTELEFNIPFIKKGTDGTTPDTMGGQIRTLATADTEEALDLGDVSTVQGIAIWAVDYDLDIDCDFVSAFDADQTAKAGEIPAVIPNPAGTVYVKNNGAGETPQYIYVVWGTT